MAENSRISLDRTDEAILAALQGDGRMSTADLARAVSLSPSATADRVRRLVDGGVITGYTACVSPAALGYPITAFVRLAYPSGNYTPLHLAGKAGHAAVAGALLEAGGDANATTTTTSKTHVRREVAHRANLPESE